MAPIGTTTTFGNPNLKPETATQMELGGTANWDGGRFDLALFQNIINNRITPVKISNAIRVGPPGLLADALEPAPEAVDAATAHLNGMVLRHSFGDVETEIAEAEDAQRAAKKKARKELREARHKKQQSDVDAKIADLKSKLHKHKKAAAPTA